MRNSGSMMSGKLGRWIGAIALALAVGLSGSLAYADGVVRLSSNARLLSRPGERAPSLVNLSAGQSVRVVGQQGRWLKVSARGRVGWITRTQVEVEEATVSARATTSRARTSAKPKARKGWNSMEDDAVGEDAADDEAEDEDDENPLLQDEQLASARKVAKAKPKAKAKTSRKAKLVAKAKKAPGIAAGAKVTANEEASVRQRPSSKADELFSVEEGQELKVVTIDEDGEWVRVQDEDGTKGWVEMSSLDAAESDDEDADDEEMADDEDADDEEADEAPRKKGKKGKRGKNAKKDMWYALGADLGVLSRSQDYTSAGTTIRGNYGVANTSPALIVGGIVSKRMNKQYLIGAEGSYTRTVGGSGLQVPAAMAGAPNETLDWMAQAIDLRGTVGMDVSKGQYQLVGRVGYHMASTTVAESTNVMLPSERISGFTVGAGLEAPKVSPKAALRVGVDMLVSAKLEQTDLMKDGESADIKAYYVNAVGTYKWKPQVDMMATYTLSYEGFGFTGANQREAAATGAQRKDTQHVLGVGLLYRF